MKHAIFACCLLTGCSLIIDSEQYVGGGPRNDGGRDGTMDGDAGPPDVRPDVMPDRLGECTPPCEPGFMCVDRSCVPDPDCNCGEGFECIDGECKPLDCELRCDGGECCATGLCINGGPCQMIACSDDLICADGDCRDPNEVAEMCDMPPCDDMDSDGAGSGGTACPNPLPDCEPFDGTVFPGAPTICGDGKINDCLARSEGGMSDETREVGIAGIARIDTLVGHTRLSIAAEADRFSFLHRGPGSAPWQVTTVTLSADGAIPETTALVSERPTIFFARLDEHNGQNYLGIVEQDETSLVIPSLHTVTVEGLRYGGQGTLVFDHGGVRCDMAPRPVGFGSTIAMALTPANMDPGITYLPSGAPAPTLYPVTNLGGNWLDTSDAFILGGRSTMTDGGGVHLRENMASFDFDVMGYEGGEGALGNLESFPLQVLLPTVAGLSVHQITCPPPATGLGPLCMANGRPVAGPPMRDLRAISIDGDPTDPGLPGSGGIVVVVADAEGPAGSRQLVLMATLPDGNALRRPDGSPFILPLLGAGSRMMDEPLDDILDFAIARRPASPESTPMGQEIVFVATTPEAGYIGGVVACDAP